MSIRARAPRVALVLLRLKVADAKVDICTSRFRFFIRYFWSLQVVEIAPPAGVVIVLRPIPYSPSSTGFFMYPPSNKPIESMLVGTDQAQYLDAYLPTISC